MSKFPIRKVNTSVLSVAYFAENEEVKNAIIQSDYIRRATLNRLWALPGVADMDRISRNKLYDKIKQDVIKEGK
jgi:hypothetical protein